MVVRTAFDATTRGGARTSGFRLRRRHRARPCRTTRRRFPTSGCGTISNGSSRPSCRRPRRPAYGSRMHPDDPPLSPLCGLERIMGSTESFDRLLAISTSPANAITFCIGCFAEMGADIPGLDRALSRAAFPTSMSATSRGSVEDFIETFPDDGQTDLVGDLPQAPRDRLRRLCAERPRAAARDRRERRAGGLRHAGPHLRDRLPARPRPSDRDGARQEVATDAGDDEDLRLRRDRRRQRRLCRRRAARRRVRRPRAPPRSRRRLQGLDPQGPGRLQQDPRRHEVPDPASTPYRRSSSAAGSS